jgi:hypothetical protein
VGDSSAGAAKVSSPRIALDQSRGPFKAVGAIGDSSSVRRPRPRPVRWQGRATWTLQARDYEQPQRKSTRGGLEGPALAMTASANACIAACQSAAVVSGPAEKRTMPAGDPGARPRNGAIAATTRAAEAAPELHAEPVEASIPPRSRAATSFRESAPGRRIARVFQSRSALPLTMRGFCLNATAGLMARGGRLPVLRYICLNEMPVWLRYAAVSAASAR